MISYNRSGSGSAGNVTLDSYSGYVGILEFLFRPYRILPALGSVVRTTGTTSMNVPGSGLSSVHPASASNISALQFNVDSVSCHEEHNLPRVISLPYSRKDSKRPTYLRDDFLLQKQDACT